MPADTLIIGGIPLTGYSVPASMMGGGKQATVVHKLPGGSRVIDVLGPDDLDIEIEGFFYGDDAYTNALTFDAMRAAGSPIALVWGGQYRTVIVEEFAYRVRRLPVWVSYRFNLTVVNNPALGALSVAPTSIDALVLGDLATALSQ